VDRIIYDQRGAARRNRSHTKSCYSRAVRIRVDADIARAETLPGEAYRSAELHALLRERVFARSWQLAPDADLVAPGALTPFTLLPGCLDEPLLLVRDAAELRCLSNVCTHRGALLCDEPCEATSLRCRYHGRRFALDGRLTHAPEFDGALDFPSARDHLPVLPLARFGPLVLTSIAPACPADELLAPVRRRLGALPIERLDLDPQSVRDYEVAANWMLYVDNYLEGLHIPFVHPSLSQALDFGAYRTELDPRGSVQVGIAKAGEDAFEGTNVAAWYFWLFPNLMLNFYPWGLSLNVVLPLGVERMRVHYRSYVLDEARRERGAGSGLDRVEHEDEAVVESVQRGIQSRLYRRGRYSPSRETGVHHFHRLLAAALDEGA
jgi:phenylpropionate dioxygenase-like ring-hydroxylating dioxygenase large terminal subunit